MVTRRTRIRSRARRRAHSNQPAGRQAGRQAAGRQAGRQAGSMATTVLLFYKYADISGKVPEVAQWQKELCTRLKLEGRILLADEGINGSLSGPAEVVQQYCDALSTSEYFAKAHAEEPIDFKTSTTDEQVLFPGLSVKQVASICGGGNIAKAPLELGGKHLTPREWHEALQRQEADNAVLLDCRNDYEYAIGRFQGAVDPGTRHFHEFADYVDKHKDQWKKQGKKVLMYCTGGIRCEKVRCCQPMSTSGPFPPFPVHRRRVRCTAFRQVCSFSLLNLLVLCFLVHRRFLMQRIVQRAVTLHRRRFVPCGQS